MLKWQGDFTLPRLRAKLANKYLLHPSVEPEYAELYRPDLSHSVIIRRDLHQGSSPFGATGGLGGTTRTDPWATQGLGATGMSANGLNVTGFTSRSGFDMTNASLGSLRSGKELPYSMRPPKRTASVPSLGTRRALVAPASLRQLPPGQPPPHVANRSLSRATSSQTLPASPTGIDPSDARAVEKERQAELASRRFWMSANGNSHYLEEEVAQIKTEDPLVTNTQILNRLKTTQVCTQMNKARKDGAKIDWRNKDWDGATLLIKAVRTDSMALAMHLVAIGCDPQVLDDSGRGLLHWVAIEGNIEMATYIFDTVEELKVDEVDSGGDTPLHLACYHGRLEVVRLLVRNQADSTRENAGGFTPVQLAEAKRAWHVSSYLNEYREQKEDQAANKEGIATRFLLRPCNQNRMNEVSMEAAAEPKKK